MAAVIHDSSYVDEDLAKPCVFSGDDKISRQGQIRSPAYSHAFQHGYNRLRHRTQGFYNLPDTFHSGDPFVGRRIRIE